MLQNLIAKLRDGQQHPQRIQSSSRLEFCHQIIPETIRLARFSPYPGLSIIVEAAVVKQESKRLLTNHPHHVVFNIVSLRRNLLDKFEHDQLNQNVPLINTSSDIPGDIFNISIAVSRIIPSRNTDASLLPYLINVVLTVPLSKVDTRIVGHKQDGIDTSWHELKDYKTLWQSQMLDTILSAVGPMVDRSSMQGNEGAHHQYRSRFGNGSHEPAAQADSQLRRMQPWASSTRISPEPSLGAYSYGNHFNFTIMVDSGHSPTHSLTVPDRETRLQPNS